MAQICLGRATDAERAQEPVSVERSTPQHFGQTPGSDAPVHFELPQPILRMHEAKRELRVGFGFRKDVRDAVRIAQHFGFGAQARHLDRASDLRQR